MAEVWGVAVPILLPIRRGQFARSAQVAVALPDWLMGAGHLRQSGPTVPLVCKVCNAGEVKGILQSCTQGRMESPGRYTGTPSQALHMI